MSWRMWENEDGTLGVELDDDGLWVRTRQSRTDMWSPPEQLKELPTDNQEEIDRSIAQHEQAMFDNPDLP